VALNPQSILGGRRINVTATYPTGAAVDRTGMPVDPVTGLPQAPTWLNKAVAQMTANKQAEQGNAWNPGNPLDWVNAGTNNASYPAFPSSNPHYPGVKTGVTQPYNPNLNPGELSPGALRSAVIAAVQNPKPIVVTKSYPTSPKAAVTRTTAGTQTNTIVPPPNMGDPNHLPGGYPTATANPNQGGGGGGGGGTSGLFPLVDASWLLGNDKNLTAITKAIMAASNVNLKGMTKEATRAAKSAVAQNVMEIVQQQNALRGESERIAQGFSAGSAAAAALNKNLPQTLQDNYNRAAQVLGGLQSGYSNDLANTASAQAGGVTGLPEGSQMTTGYGVNVAGVGPGTLPTSMYQSTYAPMANLAAGLVGAGSWGRIQSQQLPNLLLGAGTQAAQMARASGQQEAMKLYPDILQAQAKLPGLIQQNIASGAKALQTASTAKVNALTKLAGLTTMSPTDKARIWAQVQGINERQISAYMKGQGAGSTYKPTIVEDGRGGKWAIDWRTGGVTRIPIPGKPPSATGGATVSSINSLSKRIASASRGGWSWQKTAGNPWGQWQTDPNKPPMSYNQAMDIVQSVMPGWSQAKVADWTSKQNTDWRQAYVMAQAEGQIPGVPAQKIPVTATYPTTKSGAPSTGRKPKLGKNTLA